MSDDEEVFYSIRPQLESPFPFRISATTAPVRGVSPRSPAPPQTMEEVCQETRGIGSQLQENNAALQRKMEELQHKVLDQWRGKCSELQKQVEQLERELQMKHTVTQSLSPGQSIRSKTLDQSVQTRLNHALKDKDTIALAKKELEETMKALLNDKQSLENEKLSLMSQLEELKTTNQDALTQKSITEESSPRICDLEATNEVLHSQLCTEREKQREMLNDCTEQLSAVRLELASSEQNAKQLSNRLSEVQTELATSQANNQDLQQMHAIELGSLQADLAASRANELETQQRHQKELQALQAELDASHVSEQGLRERYEKQLEAALASSQDKEKQLHDVYGKELENVRKELDTTIKALSQQKLATAAMNSEREALVDDISGLSEELKVRDDQLGSAQEEIRALKQHLRETIEHTRTLEMDITNLKTTHDQLARDVAMHCAQEQRLREKNEELKIHINEQQKQEEEEQDLPPPVLSPVYSHCAGGDHVWAPSLPSPPVKPRGVRGHCPICGRNDFLSIADLELHSAKCTDFK